MYMQIQLLGYKVTWVIVLFVKSTYLRGFGGNRSERKYQGKGKIRSDYKRGRNLNLDVSMEEWLSGEVEEKV